MKKNEVVNEVLYCSKCVKTLFSILVAGIYAISTVSVLSVKAGHSVSIPCLYEPQYKNNVKYLCRGYTWDSCTYEIKTNQQNSEKYLIYDDKTQRVFTVTIKNVTHQADFYWCIVEINHRKDDGVRFQLQVTKGKNRVS